jgi:hypothetical protein
MCRSERMRRDQVDEVIAVSSEETNLLHLLHFWLVHIRAAANEGAAERARDIAHALHNVPSGLAARRTPEDIWAEVEAKCKSRGLAAFFAEAVHLVELPVGLNS